MDLVTFSSMEMKEERIMMKVTPNEGAMIAISM